MIYVLLILYKLFIITFIRPVEVGIASQYGQPGDIYGQQALACNISKHIDNYIHVCASRWLPCGTILLIQNKSNNEISWCAVMDRGPYGAMIRNQDGTYTWGMKISPRDPGIWRGILDMSPATARSMHHNGFSPVRYWVVKPHYLAKIVASM